MARDDLSREEIASLTGKTDPPAGQAAGLRPGGAASSRRYDPPASYDFRCADRLDPDLVWALESLHERAAGDFAASLSGLARAPIAVHVSGIVQATYAEFGRSLPNPTCLAVIEGEPLAATLALNLHPTALYPIIDRLLGALHESAEPVERPMTDIERRLAGRIITLMLEAMRRAWQNVNGAAFALARVETDPGLARVALPSELVVSIRFDVVLGEARGAMACCIPRSAIDRSRAQLLNLIHDRELATTLERPANRRAASVELVAELARMQMPAGELVGLRAGDVITTETRCDSPLVVAVDGSPKFYARPGAYKGRKAISIEACVPTPESSS